MSDAVMLYTNPMSRGRIARWMLEEVGCAYGETIIDYATMHDADYCAVNPMGKVPAIVHDGRVVTECAAICAYLAEAFPEAGLAPRPDERADYYRWLFFTAGPVEQAVTNHHARFDPDERQARMFGYGSYDRTIEVLAAAVSAHPFIAGDRFTAADVYVGAQVGWGTRFGTMPALDAFVAYRDRVESRPAFQRAAARDDALMPSEPA